MAVGWLGKANLALSFKYRSVIARIANYGFDNACLSPARRLRIFAIPLKLAIWAPFAVT